MLSACWAHFVDGSSISRLAVERYRDRIYRYGAELLRAEFSKFVKSEAVALCVSIDSTHMRVFCDGGDKSADLFARSLEVRSSTGRRTVCYPKLSISQSTTVSDVLSAIPMDELRIEDLVRGGRFEFLIANCAAANANKASVKMVMWELNRRNELLEMTQACAFHVLNTATIWGSGLFPYGSLLRTAHVYEARHFEGSDGRVASKLRNPGNTDPIIEIDASHQYFMGTCLRIPGISSWACFIRWASAGIQGRRSRTKPRPPTHSQTIA